MTGSKVDMSSQTWPDVLEIARSSFDRFLERHETGDNSGAAVGGPDLTIESYAFLGKLVLMGNSDEFHAKTALELGFALPRAPNTVANQNGISAFWMSPEEWLVTLEPDAERKLQRNLQESLASDHALVADVSDRWAVLRITGAQTLAVLAKGTAADLRSLDESQCCLTKLFALPVIIHRSSETPSFDIFVDATLAEFLWLWLNYSCNDGPARDRA